jgi:hypothetical protein
MAMSMGSAVIIVGTTCVTPLIPAIDYSAVCFARVAAQSHVVSG